MTPFERALGDSEKKKLSFKRKKALKETGSGSSSHLQRTVGGEGKRPVGTKDRLREREFNSNLWLNAVVVYKHQLKGMSSQAAWAYCSITKDWFRVNWFSLTMSFIKQESFMPNLKSRGSVYFPNPNWRLIPWCGLIIQDIICEEKDFKFNSELNKELMRRN